MKRVHYFTNMKTAGKNNRVDEKDKGAGLTTKKNLRHP